MENELETSPNSHAAKSGAILGGISIVITLLVYIIDITLMSQWWFELLIIIMTFCLVLVFGINYRNSIGGYLDFKSSYLYSFIMLVIAGLISTVFNILLFEFIDPEAVKLIVDATIDNAEQMMRSFGAPEDAIEESIAEMEKTMPGRFSVMGLLKQYVITIIVYAVISLITGAIIKKKEPLLG